MKIAVVGCGAVGSYYGAMLCRAGQEVHFLLRSDYEAVRHNGVLIHSPHGDFCVQPAAANVSKSIGVCDLVLIGLKTTANDQFPHLLPPLVDSHTAVITLQNGLGNEEQLEQAVPKEQILGAMCFVCLNRIAPGVIRHMDHGNIVLGEYKRPPGQRTQQIAEMFRSAGVPCDVTEDLDRSHWEKLTWNIPFNGLGVAGSAGYDAVITGQLQPGVEIRPCLPTDQLLDGARWEQLICELIHEVITGARAQGFSLSEDLMERQVNRTRTMGAYRASTLLDFEKGLPLELESLFLEPHRRATQAGALVPRLAAMCAVLRDLSASRQR